MEAASGAGEKLSILVTGKSKKPRCLNGMKNFPWRYRAHAESWMDSLLLETCAKELNNRFVSEDRKVAFIIEHCPAHTKIEGLKAVELIFLPSNTTSKTQPKDQGVIKSPNAIYCKKIIQRIIRVM